MQGGAHIRKTRRYEEKSNLLIAISEYLQDCGSAKHGAIRYLKLLKEAKGRESVHINYATRALFLKKLLGGESTHYGKCNTENAWYR